MAVIQRNMYFTISIYIKHYTSVSVGVELLPDTTVLFQSPPQKLPMACNGCRDKFQQGQTHHGKSLKF